MNEPQTTLSGKMMKFQGVSINSGRITGACCLYSAERHKAVPEYTLTNETLVADELSKFDEMLQQCSDELDAISHQVEVSVARLKVKFS